MKVKSTFDAASWVAHHSYIGQNRPRDIQNFLAEDKAKLVALDAQTAAQLRRPTVEHGHFALLLGLDLLEHFVPVGTSSVSAGLQTGDQIAFFLALVMYMCISRKRSMAPPNSACSISNCDSKFTNHSNERWSRLIQKKSTCNRTNPS
ncbi:hypothetical protein B566_EDAN000770 [Ephemera danica]|nr:hypothetical protein B566_EDAN000770 [Ephemera danica]